VTLPAIGVLAAGSLALAAVMSSPGIGADKTQGQQASALSCRTVWLQDNIANGLRRAWRAAKDLPAGPIEPEILGVCGAKWFALTGVGWPASLPDSKKWLYQDGPQIFIGSSATRWTYVSDTGGYAPRCGTGRGQFPRQLVRLAGKRCV
jgi:hypothetical protein